MTKIQMKNEALRLAAEFKAKPQFVEALTELLEQYASNAKLDTVKREKNIVVDGREYTWCNRHEVYEPSTNFKNDKADCCVLADKAWKQLSKEVRQLEESLTAKAIEGADVQGLALQLKELRELRGGRYNFEGNALQYPDIEGYIYDESKFIKE